MVRRRRLARLRESIFRPSTLMFADRVWERAFSMYMKAKSEPPKQRDARLTSQVRDWIRPMRLMIMLSKVVHDMSESGKDFMRLERDG